MSYRVLITMAALVGGAVPLTGLAEDLVLLPVQGNVYLLAGGPTNVTVQIGRDGILLVDAPPLAQVPQAMALIRTVSRLPLRYVISTALDPERVAGDQALSRYAEPLPGTERFNSGAGVVAAAGELNGMEVLAQENVLNRLTALAPAALAAFGGAVVTSEYDQPSKDFFMNGDAVIVHYAPAARTDGDSMVQFRRADVLSTGDLFTPEQYPRIDVARGGSVQGLLAALNHMLDITVPAAYEEGGTYVIPGRGRICDEADVVEYRDMVKIVSDRVQDMVRRHLTLQQARAAHPSFDYDTEYGGARGGPSGDQFIEAVYRSLTAPVRKQVQP